MEGDKNKNFEHFLIEMNSKLPGVVYVPLSKSNFRSDLGDYQGMNVLNIVVR